MATDGTIDRFRVPVEVGGGLPGLHSDPGIVPDTTDEFVAELVACGAEVQAPGPTTERVTLRSGEVWLPILVFGSEVSATALGELVAHAIVSFLRKRRAERAVLHLRVERRSLTTEVLIDVEGPASKVVEALQQLE